MKTKNKLLALLEIAIVLCSVFLVALPAIAADGTQKVSASEVTTTSEDDYVLGIYGNANEDDTIDMRDLTYVKLIFFGKKPGTELADAKYDGKINPLDFIQITLIIVGKEKELTFLDPFGEAMTVNKPVERIVSAWYTNTELLQVLDATDKIVGIDSRTKIHTTLFPELNDLPIVGGWHAPDFEAILSLRSDIYIPWLITKPERYEGPYGSSRKRHLVDKLPGITVTCMDNSEYYTGDYFIEEVKKFGYILDKKERAEEFIEFYKGCMDPVVKRTEGLSDDEKPRYWCTSLFPWASLTSTLSAATVFLPADLAGARNIAAGLGHSSVKVDMEWVMDQNPDYIFVKVWALPKSPYASDYPLSTIEGRVEEVMNYPGLANVNAVKNNNVYVVHYSHYTSGPANGICTAHMAKLFHPGLFEDFDITAIHQEYVDRFLGIDVTVNSANFLYPPLEES